MPVHTSRKKLFFVKTAYSSPFFYYIHKNSDIFLCKIKSLYDIFYVIINTDFTLGTKEH